MILAANAEGIFQWTAHQECLARHGARHGAYPEPYECRNLLIDLLGTALELGWLPAGAYVGFWEFLWRLDGTPGNTYPYRWISNALIILWFLLLLPVSPILLHQLTFLRVFLICVIVAGW